MAWQGSDRADRLPDNWGRLRRRVMARDGYQCTAVLRDGDRCVEVGTDVDHVVPGDDHDLTNLALLCRWHHARKSAREGQAARGPVLKRARGDDRPHPGAL